MRRIVIKSSSCSPLLFMVDTMTWKEEFYQLYLSPESGSTIKALEMKREHIPEKLFRYRPLGSYSAKCANCVAESKILKESRLDHVLSEIRSGQIYASPVGRLNDPFEGYSILKKDHALKKILNSDKHKKSCEEKFRDHLTDAKFKEIFDSEDWNEELLKYISDQTKSSLDETKSLFNDVLVPVIKKYLADPYTDYIRQVLRVACFSEKKINLPMWNHYANGYKGVCLEYTTEDIKNPFTVNRLFPVVYSNELPEFDFIDGNKWQERSDFICTRKLSDWRYEEEWRLLANMNFLWNVTPENISEFNECGVNVKFIKPSKIYLGFNIDSIEERIIREIAEHEKIPVSKMTCSAHGLMFEG
ncbi:MAG: DUF2971 domain-containing protein [Bacteroidales bacterium]|nr:DUF2971 domain-containing protein [Bacteroidales bacterium]